MQENNEIGTTYFCSKCGEPVLRITGIAITEGSQIKELRPFSLSCKDCKTRKKKGNKCIMGYKRICHKENLDSIEECEACHENEAEKWSEQQEEAYYRQAWGDL